MFARGEAYNVVVIGFVGGESPRGGVFAIITDTSMCIIHKGVSGKKEE